MNTTLTSQSSRITAFIDLFKVGVDSWIKAGEILVELVEEDPHSYDYIIQQCPQLNAGILGRFEQMGRKSLHPQLLLTSSPGFARLQKLPYSLQERFIEEPIALIVHTEQGTDVLLVKAKDLTKEQAAQVFAPNRLRTEGEQKAWMIQQQSNAARSSPTNNTAAAWRIKGGRVEFTAGASLSAGELATIITQLTK
jgi:hypothetical protein